MSKSNIHVAFARLFLRSLCSAGVTDLVVSPGSRSTPLALAAAEEKGLRLHVVIDERSAGFFALGQARVTGRPSALLCTSGTAPAHYLPAVIEASLSNVPLLVLSADRPWDAYDAASPQTIDQVKLFGDHVRHYAELGLPEAGALASAVRIAAQSVHRALSPTPGPVHINARFRKPLEPVDVREPEPFEAELARLMTRGAPRRVVPVARPRLGDVDELAELCASLPRGLIVAGPGPLTQREAADAAARLAQSTGFPLLAEATSQLRFGEGLHPALRCERFDAVLRSPALRQRLAPQLIIEVGAPPVSSSYATLLSEHPSVERWVIAPHGWNDPSSTATGMLFAEPTLALDALCAALDQRGFVRCAGEVAALLSEANEQARALVEQQLDRPALTEGAVVASLTELLPADALLLIGNSMPVRDLDTYAPARALPLGVLHQRGASGIDGLVAGAAGAATCAAGRPVALLLGDVSMLHDVSSLATARAAGSPLLIVVVQNSGGRIFEQLPVARRPEAQRAFERLFITTQDVSLAQAAAAFGVAYEQHSQTASLREGIARALRREGTTLIEAVVSPSEATQLRAELHQALSAKLGGAS